MRWSGLELMLVADVGLVRAPNPGKIVLSAAKSEVANYPLQHCF